VATDWERRNQRAREIGYESYTQRRELRSIARSGDERRLSREMEELIEMRIAEGDRTSIGEIYADLYDNMEGPPEDKEEFLTGIFSPAGV
jgi:hypothetical protein